MSGFGSNIVKIVTSWIRASKNGVQYYQTKVEGSLSQEPRGNLCVKPKRISDTQDNFTLIRDYVGAKRSQRERVTSKEVLHMLISENGCQLNLILVDCMINQIIKLHYAQFKDI